MWLPYWGERDSLPAAIRVKLSPSSREPAFCRFRSRQPCGPSGSPTADKEQGRRQRLDMCFQTGSDDEGRPLEFETRMIAARSHLMRNLSRKAAGIAPSGACLRTQW